MAVGIGFVLSLSAVAASAAATDHGPRAVEFRGNMRTLWENDAIYMRAVTVSLLADLPDMVRNYQRLTQCQAEIANAVRPFLGEASADRLNTLLNEQVNLACATLTAAKSGDPGRLDEARSAWRQSADRLCVSLTAMSPVGWETSSLQDLFGALLDATCTQASCRLRQDWAGDLAASEISHQQSQKLADALSLGIIRQFPDEFAGETAATLSAVPVVTSAMAVPTQAGAQIVFDLSAPATVGVQVSNMAGRPVRHVTNGYEAGVGLNSLLWNGRNDNGLHVPGGTYFVTVEVQAKGGTYSRATTTLQLVR